MTELEMVKITKEELHQLIQKKLEKAGLSSIHADTVADTLAFADSRGIHSHGAVRVDYYAERIAKGGTNLAPKFKFNQTGPSVGVFEADNGVGHFAANEALKEAITLAKETGIGVVGVHQMGHSGALAYFVKQAAEQDMIALSVCQSDPMVVPFGGAEPYFGTNPIAFATPRFGHSPVVFDMATTVQAWGKILDARSRNVDIPDTWAVDGEGNATTNPHEVKALLPIAGPKGYGLMMMVDILSGTLLGLPFGKHVSSMYTDITAGRNLGQLHIVINPSFFTDLEQFKKDINQMVEELHESKPANGFDQVLYPGELSEIIEAKYEKEGIPIVKSIYDYLQSDTIHFDQYNKASAFGEKVQ
ncbi:ureidoglycolate dehydrogenase [Carnobacterium divergens]|uniref:ureidoglycolate dehydrogenase n=1 Tax=Carnobacterium divergens TaxID=2748 RepID=UPI000D4241C6|nr:ureidoglycolate dehydrogenase [Carnobacterium divergens]MCO6017825.1 ureidoglycolate dehydrogenase [Carnobacterium divergens]TFI60762.1 ureidoglycolate dehydrogenase [Carnobacterium divergens]TFI87785.1 ureidoglycolate dehydrogenase [Carnobacterium divergens]TFJ02353.1 ureidoglycolate dehydrogenase [Carnobacterium divergens]TFJ03863.1 ureidoglycolate dehydrogenase [Carnobacterium divergens]